MTDHRSLPLFRLLVIEDNPERLELFRAWMPAGVKIVWARSAGVALGLIGRDQGYVYGAVALDHDLQDLAITADDLTLSGSDVSKALIANFHRDIPILVHSTNQIQAPRVVSQLKSAGFWVSHIPMYNLDQEIFSKWIGEALEQWEAEHSFL